MDRFTVCVAFVALGTLVLIVCEGLFEFVVLLFAAGLLLTLSFVVLVLLFLSQGSLMLVVRVSLVSGGLFEVVWMAFFLLWGTLCGDCTHWPDVCMLCTCPQPNLAPSLLPWTSCVQSFLLALFFAVVAPWFDLLIIVVGAGLLLLLFPGGGSGLLSLGSGASLVFSPLGGFALRLFGSAVLFLEILLVLLVLA